MSVQRSFTRRAFSLTAITAGGAALAGCSSTGGQGFAGGMPGWFPFGSGGEDAAPAEPGAPAVRSRPNPKYAAIYGRIDGESYVMPAVDYTALDGQFLRQEVAYNGPEHTGTIIVDPNAHHLYHVDAPGRATRYGVGVGREGFGWSGAAQINMKRDWPDWVPPREMVARDPEIRAQLTRTSRGLGVPGGPTSPLGARAMYLYSPTGSGDLGYRIHGTTEPLTVGTNVSSGCVRMINQDIIHLYARTQVGARVVVMA